MGYSPAMRGESRILKSCIFASDKKLRHCILSVKYGESQTFSFKIQNHLNILLPRKAQASFRNLTINN